jgi:hypothetical protein
VNLIAKQMVCGSSGICTFKRNSATVREGQFREIEFPHQIGPCHPKPITKCHVALFDNIYLIYAKSDLHVGYMTTVQRSLK